MDSFFWGARGPVLIQVLSTPTFRGNINIALLRDSLACSRFPMQPDSSAIPTILALNLTLQGVTQGVEGVLDAAVCMLQIATSIRAAGREPYGHWLYEDPVPLLTRRRILS